MDDKYEFFPSNLIGKGAYGEIYACKDIQLVSDNDYAIKFENNFVSDKIKLEKELYEAMLGFEGFANIYSSGTFKNKHYLIMERLGPNLKDLYIYCNYHFSLQTILLIGIQIISRLQDLHYKSGYIHNDIKPDNFCIGIQNTNIIYMIDYSMSKPFRAFNFNTSKMEHIPYKENLKPNNCNKYSSINHLMGIETSRRDDLESLGYMLIYFANHGLPWQGGSKSNKREKCRKMLNKKLTIPVEVYCKDLPIEFSIYMNYVCNLRYDEKPDYIYLKGLFADLLFSFYIEKFFFDWTNESPKEIPINLRINKELDNKYLFPTKNGEEDKLVSSEGEISNEEEESSDDIISMKSEDKENLLKNNEQMLEIIRKKLGSQIKDKSQSFSSEEENNKKKKKKDNESSDESKKVKIKITGENNESKISKSVSLSQSSSVDSDQENKNSEEGIKEKEENQNVTNPNSPSVTASYHSKRSSEEEDDEDLDRIYNEIKEAPRQNYNFKVINSNMGTKTNPVSATPSFGSDPSKIKKLKEIRDNAESLKIGAVNKVSGFGKNSTKSNKLDPFGKSARSNVSSGSMASDYSTNLLKDKKVQPIPNYGKIRLGSDRYIQEEEEENLTSNRKK